MSHADEEAIAARDEIGVPTVELARLTGNYWMEAAGSGTPVRLRDFALDVADYAGLLVWRAIPGGNWEAVYDTWLARATQHAVQAQALGRD